MEDEAHKGDELLNLETYFDLLDFTKHKDKILNSKNAELSPQDKRELQDEELRLDGDK